MGPELSSKAIYDLFPWLPHLFADSVYNGPNLRAARNAGKSAWRRAQLAASIVSRVPSM